MFAHLAVLMLQSTHPTPLKGSEDTPRLRITALEQDNNLHLTGASSLLLRIPYQVYIRVVDPGLASSSRLCRARPLVCKPDVDIGPIWFNCIISSKPLWRLIFINASLRGLFIKKPVSMDGISSGCHVFKMNLEKIKMGRL